jgi:hypothetical protein
MLCAKRPLKWNEIQTLRSLDLENGAVEFEERCLQVTPKDLCESLVDVHPDGTLEFVHTTVKM